MLAEAGAKKTIIHLTGGPDIYAIFMNFYPKQLLICENLDLRIFIYSHYGTEVVRLTIILMPFVVSN